MRYCCSISIKSWGNQYPEISSVRRSTPGDGFSTARRQDTWKSGLIMMVSEKIDNGNTLISDDVITWILDTSAGAREPHSTQVLLSN